MAAIYGIRPGLNLYTTTCTFLHLSSLITTPNTTYQPMCNSYTPALIPTCLCITLFISNKNNRNPCANLNSLDICRDSLPYIQVSYIKSHANRQVTHTQNYHISIVSKSFLYCGLYKSFGQEIFLGFARLIVD